MSDTTTLKRNLEILMMLTKPGGINVRQIAERYGVSARTIQRLIKQFRDTGYVIEDSEGNYMINKMNWKKLVITILRVTIGWHLVYEGFSKLMADNWTAEGFLSKCNRTIFRILSLACLIGGNNEYC